ncbi:tyrosine-type recombinase/integrase [Cronobacter sakazakii]|nr:tyrosine-type recombinase/integrase [Cronobacter sakazakii]
MSTVHPIPQSQLNTAEKYLRDNHDPAFVLMFRIGIETGLRISDILSLRWDNLTGNTITVTEAKGTKARQARAARKVLESVKQQLIVHYGNDPQMMMRVFITSPGEIIPLIPSEWREDVAERIKAARDSAPAKVRTVTISKRTLDMLHRRKEKFQEIDGGDIFSRRTLRGSNRARNQNGTITRQSAWTVLSGLNEVLNTVKRVACHSLRKVFARGLYFASQKDIGLLMTVIGHSSPAMSLRYIGISDDDENTAVNSWLDALSNR